MNSTVIRTVAVAVAALALFVYVVLPVVEFAARWSS